MGKIDCVACPGAACRRNGNSGSRAALSFKWRIIDSVGGCCYWVLNLLHLWSARLRVSACEKEPGIVRPFITCCPRQDWGRRASRDSPGVYYAVLRNQERGKATSESSLLSPVIKGGPRAQLGSGWELSFPRAAPPLTPPLTPISLFW